MTARRAAAKSGDTAAEVKAYAARRVELARAHPAWPTSRRPNGKAEWTEFLRLLSKIG